MAMWYPSECSKMTAWVDFPNMTLRNGRCLTLGMCDVQAKNTGCLEETSQRAVFVAGKSSKLWSTMVMFGALQPCVRALCTLLSEAMQRVF